MARTHSTGTIDYGNGRYATPVDVVGGAAGDSLLTATGGIPADLSGALDSTIDSISTEGRKATYSAAATATLTNGDGVTVLFAVRGSATKTVRVRRLTWFLRAAGTPRQYIWQLAKYSTFPTGGTMGGMTAVPHDSADAAATGAAAVWTVHPTAGTLVGNLAIATAAILDSDALADGTYLRPELRCDLVFGANDDKAIVLRGAAEGLGIALLGFTAVTNDLLVPSVTWTEE